jgi:hypothetical protein
MTEKTMIPSFAVVPNEELEALKKMISELYDLKKQDGKLLNYLSKENVCKHMQWGEATWYRLRKDGLIRVYRIGKKQYVKADELTRALDQGLI